MRFQIAAPAQGSSSSTIIKHQWFLFHHCTGKALVWFNDLDLCIEDCRIIKGNTLICKIITQKINLIQNYPLPFLQDDGYFKWRACLTPLNRIPRMEKDFNFLHSSLSLILVLEQGDYLKTISSSILVNDSILLNIIHCHFAASTFSSSEPRI